MLKNWKEEAEEILQFHEAKQKEFGKSKQGRPDVVAGKQGWSIRDTAKHFGKTYFYVHERLGWASKLRNDPTYDPRLAMPVGSRTNGKTKLADFLGKIKTTIYVLKQDKRTLKIGNDLEKALREYES